MSAHHSRRRAALAVVAAWTLVGSGCLFGGSSDEHVDIGDNRPDIGLAFGDSISHGRDSLYSRAIDDAGPDEPGYRVRLEELFATDGRTVRVREDGSPGTLSEDGVERIAASLSATRPAFVVVLYGMNDALFGRSPVAVANNLRLIAEECRRNGSIVVLCTIPPACGNEAQLAQIRLYNPLIRGLADELDAAWGAVYLADVFQAFEDTAADPCWLVNPDDGVHPTRQGYELIGATVYGQLGDVSW